MPLGIICALSAEIKTITKKKISIGTVVTIPDDILLVLSGMGAERAQRAADLLLSKGATALLSWGSAAALDAELSPGSVLLPKTVISAKREQYTATQAWHEHIHQCLAPHVKVHVGTLVESPVVLTSRSQKRAISKAYGAIAADMETAMCGKIARNANVPFLAVRAISDTVEMRIPQRVIEAVDKVGLIALHQILTEVILNPKDWPALVRLAWGMRAPLTPPFHRYLHLPAVSC